eukprot:1361406-Prymnesium_polylepis.1
MLLELGLALGGGRVAVSRCEVAFLVRWVIFRGNPSRGRGMPAPPVSRLPTLCSASTEPSSHAASCSVRARLTPGEACTASGAAWPTSSLRLSSGDGTRVLLRPTLSQFVQPYQSTTRHHTNKAHAI